MSRTDKYNFTHAEIFAECTAVTNQATGAPA